MKLQNIYKEVVRKGIEADIRTGKQIEKLLKQRKATYEKMDKKEKVFFDGDSLSNPFSDTRIVTGDPKVDVRSMIVGIDIDGEELLLVERLREKGDSFDLVVGHHPIGRAYANFYEVMDLQVDAFLNEGVSLGTVQHLLTERKAQVARRVHAVNHQKIVDIARLLKINLFCMHTPCDNLAYHYMKKKMEKAKPSTLGEIIELLYTIPEYENAARNNNPPHIIIGNKTNRCQKIHIEFTGGTEGPQNIYEKLSSCGIDTIIAMHQSEEHYKKCKEAHINVIVASHIASDTLGVNLMLDHLQRKEKFKVYECSGFRRFTHTKK